MTISVVIPTLNEEKTLQIVLEELPKGIDQIVIVDGHSKDKTVEIAKKFEAKVVYDSVGKGSAVRKGLKIANGDYLIMMDADYSHRGEEIPSLIKEINKGYDICMGSRFIGGGKSDDITYFRSLGNKLFVFLVNVIWKSDYTDLCYGYRAIRKSCLKELDLKSDGFEIETEISIKAAKKKLKVIEIPSYERKRLEGEAKLRTFNDGFRIIRQILKELFE